MLRSILLDTQTPLFSKYGVMYYIRDSQQNSLYSLYGDVLSRHNRENTTVLMRHEACFILGQISKDALVTLPQVKEAIEDSSESAIVRHEAISAYVELSDDKELLVSYSRDSAPLVSESCVVALDLMDYWSTA